MARARNIKPGFFKNEVLAEMSAFDRLLFIGLWCLADREGRVEDRPKRIKMELFPCDTYDVDTGIEELKKYGFVTRYEISGKKTIAIVNFLIHQTPHGTEKDSDLPDENGNFTIQYREKGGYASGKKRTNNVKAPEINVHDEFNVKSVPFSGSLTVNPPLDNALNPDSLNPDSLNPEIKDKAQAPPVIPDWMPADSWSGYIEMRRKQKKPPTRRATELVVKSLQGMLEKGIDVSMVLDTSTRNCWTDVYEPKASSAKTKNIDKWWIPAGFDNEWEARSDNCEPSTAKFFRDGKRIAQAVA